MKCRNCKSKIHKGTLCNKCLKSLNIKLLTKQEQTQHNNLFYRYYITALFIELLIIIAMFIIIFTTDIIKDFFAWTSILL